MNRRDFTQLAGVSGIGLFTGAPAFASTRQSAPKNTFNLAYAPHLGMFRHHAGNDPIDQLNFMADQGFTAFEDNGMRTREVVLQEKMAKTMEKGACVWEFLLPMKSIGKSRIWRMVMKL